MASLPYQPMY